MSHSRIGHLTLELTIKVFLLIWSTTSVISVNNDYATKIIAYDNINDGLGSYSFRFETSDGTQRSEEGNIEVDPVQGQVYRVRGSYSYIGTDGIVYTVRYTADENGFHPIGSHIPGSAGPATTARPPEASFAALPPEVISSLLG